MFRGQITVNKSVFRENLPEKRIYKMKDHNLCTEEFLSKARNKNKQNNSIVSAENANVGLNKHIQIYTALYFSLSLFLNTYMISNVLLFNCQLKSHLFISFHMFRMRIWSQDSFAVLCQCCLCCLSMGHSQSSLWCAQASQAGDHDTQFSPGLCFLRCVRGHNSDLSNIRVYTNRLQMCHIRDERNHKYKFLTTLLLLCLLEIC